MQGTISGNELVLIFSPPLENARTYKLQLGDEVSAAPGQFVMVRCLAGDVRGRAFTPGEDGGSRSRLGRAHPRRS